MKGLPPLIQLIKGKVSPQAEKQMEYYNKIYGGNKPVKVSSTSTNTSTSELPEPQNVLPSQLVQLAVNFQNLILAKMNEYETITGSLLKANQLYEQKLSQVIPAIALSLGKAPFSQLTDPDLPQKIGKLLEYTPYTAGIGNVSKLVKGYYLAKVNGVDTTNMAPDELVLLAENPVLAKGLPEQLGQMLETYAQSLQLNINNNLKQIGIIKDMFSVEQKYLSSYATVLKSLMSGIVSSNRIDMEQAYHEAMMQYRQLMAEAQQERLYYMQTLAGLKQQSIQEEIRHHKAQEKHWKDEENKPKKSNGLGSLFAPAPNPNPQNQSNNQPNNPASSIR